MMCSYFNARIYKKVVYIIRKNYIIYKNSIFMLRSTFYFLLSTVTFL